MFTGKIKISRPTLEKLKNRKNTSFNIAGIYFQ